MNHIEGILKGSARWGMVRGEFVDAQDGHCAICGDNVRDRPNLDHCHDTGFIRGVLCTACNSMLGWYEKRRRAIETYLARADEFTAYQHVAHTRRHASPHPRSPDRLAHMGRLKWLRKYWSEKEFRD